MSPLATSDASVSRGSPSRRVMEALWKPQAPRIAPSGCRELTGRPEPLALSATRPPVGPWSPTLYTQDVGGSSPSPPIAERPANQLVGESSGRSEL